MEINTPAHVGMPLLNFSLLILAALPSQIFR